MKLIQTSTELLSFYNSSSRLPESNVLHFVHFTLKRYFTEIPDNHDLANTYYEQYGGEFESDDGDEDETEMFTQLQSLMSSNDTRKSFYEGKGVDDPPLGVT